MTIKMKCKFLSGIKSCPSFNDLESDDISIVYLTSNIAEYMTEFE